MLCMCLKANQTLALYGSIQAHTACILAVSSEAMLGNQKPPYKLLVRAVNQQSGQEVPYITSAVSEDFVVSFLT